MRSWPGKCRGQPSPSNGEHNGDGEVPPGVDNMMWLKVVEQDDGAEQKSRGEAGPGPGELLDLAQCFDDDALDICCRCRIKIIKAASGIGSGVEGQPEGRHGGSFPCHPPTWFGILLLGKVSN